jgi:hypothetical protein
LLKLTEYILFMHDDATDRASADDGALWSNYIRSLRQTGQFDGGSSIGSGVCLKKSGYSVPATANPTGFIRVRAENLHEARRFLKGNPVYEAGGTVEIRELPRDE